MRAYLARRVVQALVVLVLVSLGGFTVLHLAPGGPVAIYAMSPTMSAEDMERLTRQLGLDQPLHVQYAKWAGGLVTANWGRSYRDGRVVLEVIADRIPATLVLMLSAFTVAVVLGLTTGIVSAVRQYSIFDHAMTLGAMVALSIPRSEEHTSELQSHSDLVCRLLLEKKNSTPKHLCHALFL